MGTIVMLGMFVVVLASTIAGAAQLHAIAAARREYTARASAAGHSEVLEFDLLATAEIGFAAAPPSRAGYPSVESFGTRSALQQTAYIARLTDAATNSRLRETTVVALATVTAGLIIGPLASSIRTVIDDLTTQRESLLVSEVQFVGWMIGLVIATLVPGVMHVRETANRRRIRLLQHAYRATITPPHSSGPAKWAP